MNQLTQFFQQISKSILPETSQYASTHVSGNLQAYLTSSYNTNSWIIDSGATDHMANNSCFIHDFLKVPLLMF